jgi:hypothetical protein
MRPAFPRTSVSSRPLWSALALAFCGIACSAAEDNAAGPRAGVNEPEGANFFEQEGNSGGNGGVDDFLDDEGKPIGPVNARDACVISRERGTLVEQPVDIIFLLDNSGSMDDELQAVEDNINLNFASILIDSGIDYRVILISRHRIQPREEDEAASTSVCVTTPLSNLANCERAPEPILTDRFYQYSTKVDSVDSFDILLDTYAPPYTDDDREEKYDNAPLGWSEWLRPEAKQVFLEVTDDDEDMSMQAFLTELTSMAPEHFGAGPETPDFVFHSIVGLAEKPIPTEAYLPEEPLVTEECTGNEGDVTSVGTTYQELSRLTGGLRFPLCQFDAYDVVFQRIAEDVVQTSTIACDFAIPPDPANANLDLNNIAVSYTPGNGGKPLTFGQATSAAGCEANAFYIASNGVNLCPEACAMIRSDPAADVAVLFTCESQIILR